MATPHPNSVISTLLKDYWEELYDAIIVKEDYCYNTTITKQPEVEGGEVTYLDGEDVYKPFFTGLDTAIETWMNINRSDELYDWFTVLYGLIALNISFDINGQDVLDSDAYQIFNMDGLDYLITQPDDYYHDYDPELETADRLTADINRINNARSKEIPLLNSKAATIKNGLSAFSMKTMFESVPAVGVASKKDVAMVLFNDLHYSKITDFLSTGSIQTPLSSIYDQVRMANDLLKPDDNFTMVLTKNQIAEVVMMDTFSLQAQLKRVFDETFGIQDSVNIYFVFDQSSIINDSLVNGVAINS